MSAANSGSLPPQNTVESLPKTGPVRVIPSAIYDPSRTDFVSIAIAYAEEAIEDRKRQWACQWIRCAARRFIADLKRAQRKKAPFWFNPKRANAHCAFIENLPHVEGHWDSAKIILQPAQIFFVVQLFGFRNERGGRRFTEALFAVARKNAKSTLAAAILLSCLCLERELGPQLLSAATTGSQARIVFNVAKRMVEMTPDLAGTFELAALANSIVRDEVGGVLKPINAKASTQDGLNPSHTNLDEIHAHKTHDLLNVLRSAAGARDNPLFLYTTTEGYENPGPWSELRHFARQVLQRVLAADHFLALIFALDDDDEDEADFDERYWIKANPLLPTNPTLLREIRKLAINAQAMPGTHAEFRIKRLNRPSSSATAMINLTKWNRCGGAVPLETLVGAPCWGAFDLAATTDMTAWRLLWWYEHLWWTWGRYWVPADAVAQRTESQRVPYAGWVRAKWLTQTDGDVTDYAVIERDIVADCGRFSPSKIAYDPWNASGIVTNLTNQGLPLELFIQAPRSYNPAINALELAYTAGRLRHGGDPVLRWNAANFVPRRDANMNRAPDRKRSADKIDGMCALAMAFGLAQVDDQAGFEAFLAHPVSA